MKTINQQYDVIFTTELATIGLKFEESKLIRVEYLNNKSIKIPKNKIAEKVKNKIEKYLKSSSKAKKLNIDVQLNVTPFQKKVLDQLQKIPYGETRTYGEIAKILKTSPRAVGNACRNNPVPIVIPCHRVLAANGIGGYDGAKSGALLNIKRDLLKKEGISL
ncbi:Methylated-DNA--protein-cysteine methyltransferase [hydrothermal vent metagenome]|uniref:Methylated-DNA--protein-cysteine methyltransferase n=1 Tax=hydrothermal vent metagenome TaxID=652676 RepID=A0A3B0X2U6_9ZZZZ